MNVFTTLMRYRVLGPVLAIAILSGLVGLVIGLAGLEGSGIASMLSIVPYLVGGFWWLGAALYEAQGFYHLHAPKLRTHSRSDDRAIGLGFLEFFAILIIAALLYVLLDPSAVTIFDQATGYTSNAEAQSAVDTRKQIWGSILFVPIFFAGLFVIARAVFESKRP